MTAAAWDRCWTVAAAASAAARTSRVHNRRPLAHLHTCTLFISDLRRFYASECTEDTSHVLPPHAPGGTAQLLCISRPVARQSYPAPALPTGHGGPNRMMCRPETHNYVNALTAAAPPPAKAKRKHETAKKQKQSISSPAIIHGLKDTQAWLRRPGHDAARLAPATSCRQLHLLLSNPRETLACIDDLQPSPALFT